MEKKSLLMGYEWMTRHTPQEAWIKGKGVWLWLAFFLTEMGAGIYFVSLFIDSPTGWLFGWLVALVLGGLAHLAYLGKPIRGWRILLKPANSELSRGLWAIILFAVIGFFQIAPVAISGLPWTGDGQALKVIMGVICILIIIHGFLTMSVVKALPMWNSGLMIPLALVSGIWVGSQFVELMLVVRGEYIALAELWARWSLLGYIGVLGMFLWSTNHSSMAAQVSVRGLLSGGVSKQFYIGVIVIGLLIPLIITLAIWANSPKIPNSNIIFLRLVCVLIGDLTMRYSILRGAKYSPLI
jgi:formate-dependent nitrite reductase membrane component NrfD